jgi:predicted porin
MLLNNIIVRFAFAAAAVLSTANVWAAEIPAPQVYGRFNLLLGQYQLETLAAGVAVDEKDNWQLDSNASRLGVQGEIPVNETLAAVYQIEYEIAADDGLNSNGRELSQRNVAAGFKGNWGTLIAGKYDTPLKSAQGKVDLFNDLPLGDIRSVLIGENRPDNVVLYTSPKLGGLTFNVAIIQLEQDGVTEPAPGDSEANDSGPADSYSASAVYEQDALYLALAVDSNVLDSTDATRFVAEYTFGPVKLGAILQKAEADEEGGSIGSVGGEITQFGGPFSEQDAQFVSAEWKATKTVRVKFQHGSSESTIVPVPGVDLGTADAALTVVGVDFVLDKNAKWYVYSGTLEVEGDAVISTDSTTDQILAAGYEIKF